MVVNLLDNALKYGPAEQTVRVELERDGTSGGSGIGLAVVRSLVMQHGGTVSVQGAPGGGACFLIVLPLAGTTSITPEMPVPVAVAPPGALPSPARSPSPAG